MQPCSCNTTDSTREAEDLTFPTRGKGSDRVESTATTMDLRFHTLISLYVRHLRNQVHGSRMFNIQLVVSSASLRTMQTATGVFDHEVYLDGKHLKSGNAGNYHQKEILSQNPMPIIALELCRGRLGVYFWKKRRSIKEYRSLFLTIDFSKIENDADVFWKDSIEEEDDFSDRAMKFINWLWTREETEIAVVSHKGFLFRFLKALGNSGFRPLQKTEIGGPFKNCEIRSVVIFDRSATRSYSSIDDLATEVGLSSGAA